MRIKNIIFSALAMLLWLGAQAGNTTTTVEQVDEEVTLTEDVDYVITSTTPFATTGSVNIVNTDHAVLIFKYIKPSKVISSYLSNVYINGVAASNEKNCTVQMYDNGAIVFPYTESDTPLICYTEENFEGDSYSNYNLNNSDGYMQTLGTASLNNKIRSFKLRRGYMVTFAMGTGGWGYQRCFIADTEDLEVSSVPTPLNGKISSYRLFHWYNAQKKGVANTTDLTVTDALNASWCYAFHAGTSTLPDTECIPHHIKEGWPSISSLGQCTYSCHMKTNNEPGNSSDDSPATVDEVLDNWQDLMRTGMRLCSESSHDGSMTHLKSFIDSIDARGWRCDLLDLHCYWAASKFYNLTWHSNYYGNGRPIWISEWVWGASWNTDGIFGSVSDTSSYSEANQTTCYNGTVPLLTELNSNTRVERYAYWNSEANASKIYISGYGLTKLGQYYADMESGLGYNPDEEFVPIVVYNEPSALSSTYTKKSGQVQLTWTDPNGDMLDSIVVQCKLPGSSSWTKIGNVTVRDKSSSSDISYTFNDTISDTGIYYYRVREYYNNKSIFTTSEVSHTVAGAKSVGALQYGQIKMTGTDALSTDIETQSVAPYVVMGMISNKNSTNGITNNLMTLGTSAFKFRFLPWTLETAVEVSTAESVDFLVLPGDTVMHLTDDMMLQTGSAGKVKGSEVEVTFAEAYPEGVTPVVVAQQNTSVTSASPVSVKISNVTNEGFTVKLVQQEGVTKSQSQQNVNYYACTPGQVAIGEGKLLTVCRNTVNPVGGSASVKVPFLNEEGDTLYLQNPYIIGAPQTHNYDAASVFRQVSSTSADEGTYLVTVKRQMDGTSTNTTSNRAATNGDYLGWFIISDDTTGETSDQEAIILPASVAKIQEATQSGDVFDLSGRRVSQPTAKGVYIKNRTKYTIK